MTPFLTIVIPTHKRAGILQKTVEHLERQTIAGQIEVIVVSDGPDQETKWRMEDGGWKIPVRYFEIPKSQQGVARNRGVDEARGQRILFIGDDIFLEPNASEKHLGYELRLTSYEVAAIHDSRNPKPGTRNIAILGHTTWDPAVGITPVMTWLEKTGWQFGYPMIAPYAHLPIPPSLQHRFTYTSHISLPTDIAKKIRFREDVTFYGWEDIEWGWRLMKEGIPLIYEPDAKALHHHHVTLENSLERMETIGRSARVMETIAPELGLVPRGLRAWKYRIASLFPTLRGLHAAAFLRGCREKA